MLILVRHGRTPANEQGLLQGRLDQDLDAYGRRQAVAVADFIGETCAVDEVIASPLLRAQQTAAAFGLQIETDPEWMELSYGEYEGTPHGDVPAEVWQRWSADPHFAPVGGESLAALDARVRIACEALIERATDRNLVVVSHVSPIKAAVGWALDVDLSVGIAFNSHLDQASVCRIIFRAGRPLLQSFNECARGLPEQPEADWLASIDGT